MSTYQIYFTTVASVSVEVEADDLGAAIDAAYDELPGDVCAQCGGWGKSYSLDLSGDWDLDEGGYMVDGELVEVTK